MLEYIDSILSKGWKVNITFSAEESYCFIFSKQDNELGFSKMPGYEQSVIHKAFERALKKEEQLKKLKQEKLKNQPLLYEEEE